MIIGGSVFVVVATLVAGAFIPSHSADNVHKLASALGLVFEPLAWPVVVLAFMLLFPDHVAGLINRIRKAPGVDFDPPPPVQAPSKQGDLGLDTSTAPKVASSTERPAGGPSPSVGSTALASTDGTVSQALEYITRLKTPAVAEAVDFLNRLPFVHDLRPAERPEALTTLAARYLVNSQFEGAEGQIWASQIKLLEYLKAEPGGTASREVIRNLFFAPAAEKDPKRYNDYSFERYVAFLQSFNLVVGDAVTIKITTLGAEYLVWRTTMSKMPKLAG